MSKPKISSQSDTLAMMPGEIRTVHIFQCGWCSDDIEAENEVETEEEARSEFVRMGVREVETDDVFGIFCPKCVELARKNKLEA